MQYAWVIPMNSKSALDSLATIKILLHQMNQLNTIPGVTSPKPESFFSDHGTEFVNRLVINYLRQNNIRADYARSDVKASFAER